MFTRIGAREVVFNTEGAAMTKQSFKDECDIHNILKRHALTGVIEHLNPRAARYGDVSEVATDYQATLNGMIEAQAAFDALPQAVRERYGDNPAGLLAALEQGRDGDFLREAGILAPLPAKPAQEAEKGASGDV